MPGHAIEPMWFVMHLAQRRDDTDLICLAAEAMRWHLERGWDPEFGDIFHALDLEGHEPNLLHSEKKLWWPHTDALYGTLMAHELTGEVWCLDWFENVASWAWTHFPVPETGEWRQRLTQQGTLLTK